MMSRDASRSLAERFDVAVIGGGAAGLSGALVLARSRRTVLVIDAGAPRNAPAARVHGFLTRDGIGPSDLLMLGRHEVEQYGGRIVHGAAVNADLAAEDTRRAVAASRDRRSAAPEPLMVSAS